MPDKRIDKIHYYLNIAKAVSERSTCRKTRWGCVIVKDDEIVSTGYNGAPRGMTDCLQRDECIRIKHNIPSGTNYSFCRSVHAEENALLSAGRKMALHGTLYMYGWDLLNNRVFQNPGMCVMCRRLTINAGIERVVFADPAGICYMDDRGYGYRIEKVADWVAADELPLNGLEGQME